MQPTMTERAKTLVKRGDWSIHTLARELIDLHKGSGAVVTDETWRLAEQIAAEAIKNR